MQRTAFQRRIATAPYAEKVHFHFDDGEAVQRWIESHLQLAVPPAPWPVADIDRVFAQAGMPQIIDTLESTDNDWARATAEVLRHRSPLMLHVVLEQVRRARAMGLADELRMERDHFVRNLRLMMAPAFAQKKHEVQVLKTVAQQKQGITELARAIDQFLAMGYDHDRRFWLLADKAWVLIQKARMKAFDKKVLYAQIREQAASPGFNLYRFVEDMAKP